MKTKPPVSARPPVRLGLRLAMIAAVAAAVVAVVLILGGYGNRRQRSANANANARTPSGEGLPSSDHAAEPVASPDDGMATSDAGHDSLIARELSRLPSSLRGTAIDGELQENAAGHLVVSERTKRFFDYFLTATGEESGEMIRRRVEQAARGRVGKVAADEAMKLFDDYGAFRRGAGETLAAIRDRSAGSDRDDDYARKVSALRALRRQYLGQVRARDFFREDEALEDSVLEQRDREAKGIAVSEPKVATKDEIFRSLPEPEKQKARTEAFGAAAAGRLAALDAEDADWTRRIEAYRAERDRLPAANPESRAAAIEELRRRFFSEEERIRVDALDRIASKGTIPAR